jgi:hypothetical protein
VVADRVSMGDATRPNAYSPGAASDWSDEPLTPGAERWFEELPDGDWQARGGTTSVGP